MEHQKSVVPAKPAVPISGRDAEKIVRQACLAKEALRKETEAWVLADGFAVTSALGYAGFPATVGLPADAIEAEGLPDPKATLSAAIRQIRGRRRPVNVDMVFPAIAQRQSLDALRRARSFRKFEFDLRLALSDLRCVAPPA